MAVNAETSAAQRRVAFGINAVVQAVLAIIVAIGVIWLAGKWSAQADWTSARLNSLSPRTVNLLHTLPENIRITSLFAEPDQERQPLQRKRWRELRDILELYDSAGGAKVSARTLEPTLAKTETEELLKRLANLPAYRDEAAPHREALARFEPLKQRVTELAGGEYQQARELAAAAPAVAQERTFELVLNSLQSIVEVADSVTEELKMLEGGEIPHYGEALGQVRTYLTQVQQALRGVSTWMTSDGVRIGGLTPELREFFEQSMTRYSDVLAEIDQLLADTQELKEVKLEDLHQELARWRDGATVLVESEHEARVIPFNDIWQAPLDRNIRPGPEGETREFAAEAAISSAILQLTQHDRTAVVFTYYGGPSPIQPDYSQMNPAMQQVPRAPYQELVERLEKANFLTGEWNVEAVKEPPVVGDAARTVYVVFRPSPPPRPNPMRPSPETGMTAEDRQLVEKAVEASGMAVFLVGWRLPQSPLPGATEMYEYGSYLKEQWGVDVRSEYVALAFMPNPQKPGWWVPAGQKPWLLTTDRVLRLTDHPISASLRTTRAAFWMTAPLAAVPKKERPEGLEVDTVVEVRKTEDAWAIVDLQRLFEEEFRRNEGTRQMDGDLGTPFPVAMAATNADGKKVVVFGSSQFAEDGLANATGLMAVGKSVVLGQVYPANSDLFINTLHWLTGEADRIAVGPRRASVPRLTGLDETGALFVRWFLVGIWPASILVIGVCVWLIRRR
ncbi:MAG: hypothetical protein PVJ57_01360 [Phycisphaerae bacterium]|jgi:hypothetical protein